MPAIADYALSESEEEYVALEIIKELPLQQAAFGTLASEYTRPETLLEFTAPSSKKDKIKKDRQLPESKPVVEVIQEPVRMIEIIRPTLERPQKPQKVQKI